MDPHETARFLAGRSLADHSGRPERPRAAPVRGGHALRLRSAGASVTWGAGETNRRAPARSASPGHRASAVSSATPGLGRFREALSRTAAATAVAFDGVGRDYYVRDERAGQGHDVAAAIPPSPLASLEHRLPRMDCRVAAVRPRRVAPERQVGRWPLLSTRVRRSTPTPMSHPRRLTAAVPAHPGRDRSAPRQVPRHLHRVAAPARGSRELAPLREQPAELRPCLRWTNVRSRSRAPRGIVRVSAEGKRSARDWENFWQLGH